ncbi:MAG TPA: hypothetical protein VD867_13715 [Burkholderiales bacterium]|nr:hypothetical protein [Burkholderiales bacterium]
MNRTSEWCVALALCAALGACSKSEAPKADQKAPPQAVAPKAEAPPPPPKGPTVSGKGMPGASFDSRVCAALKKTLKNVNEQTPALDVTTNFATDIVSAFLDSPLELNDKMPQIDAAATSACPAERTKILPMLRKANLADAFLSPADPAKTAGAAQKK